MSFSRRKFLRGLAIGGGAAMALGKIRIARAAPASQHKLVFAYFQGGWDILMGLDARDPGNLPSGIQLLWDSRQFEERYRNITPTNLMDADGRPVLAGPCMTEMVRHFDVSAILRGVVTDTVSHQVGAYYWFTGRFPSGEIPRGSSVTTSVAAQHGGSHLGPHLSIGGIETFNDGLPSYATALSVYAPGDFAILLGRGRDDRYTEDMRRLISAHQNADRPCTIAGTDRASLVQRFLGAKRKVAETERASIASQLDLFSANAPADVQMLRDEFGASADNPYSPASYAALSFLAMKNDLVDAVSVTLTGNLDTHGNEWGFTQGPQQAAGFDALAKLIDRLKATPSSDGNSSMLDHTTIVVSSEFGRTPTLNGSGGRDHWPCNTA